MSGRKSLAALVAYSRAGGEKKKKKLDTSKVWVPVRLLLVWFGFVVSEV